MRNIFIFTLLISAVFCSAFQVDTFGPVADDFSCANLDQMPASFGIRINNQEKQKRGYYYRKRGMLQRLHLKRWSLFSLHFPSHLVQWYRRDVTKCRKWM